MRVPPSTVGSWVKLRLFGLQAKHLTCQLVSPPPTHTLYEIQSRLGEASTSHLPALGLQACVARLGLCQTRALGVELIGGYFILSTE